MNLATVQAHARTCLTANTAFAGVDILLENDEAATPDELAATDAAFERALLTKGVAVIVLAPFPTLLDQERKGGVSLDLIMPVVVCENPQVNRAAADATATPPRTPLNKRPRYLLEAAIGALCAAGYRFPAQPFGQPRYEEGFVSHYLMPQIRHLIRAEA